MADAQAEGVRPRHKRPGVGLRRVAEGLIAPVAAGLLIWLGAGQLGPSVRAAAHHGTPGTYVVISHSYGRASGWTGTFTSDDGTDVRSYVGFSGHAPDGAGAGDRLAALDTGGFNVYSAGGNVTCLFDALVVAVGLAVLVGWSRGYLAGFRGRVEAAPEGYPLPDLRVLPGPPVEPAAIDRDLDLWHAARQRERRRLARRIVAEDPERAATLAIGRPDLDRDFVDGGLIDVNHVPAWVLADLPGFTPELAERVVAARDRVDHLRCGADLVAHADVPADLVESLHDVLVFPASAAGD